ncbi:MAG TPA: hypothetical protein VKV39_04765 [Candidatus Sulfotelmatobacter sp.]|nr:hypothetical protein [Candidatus Sulfotelmatobacter sp.]
MRFGQAWFALAMLLLFAWASWAQNSPTASLVLPSDASAPVKFGAAALQEALTQIGWKVSTGVKESRVELEIVVAESAKGSSKITPAEKAPDKPESFSITFSPDKHTAHVNGSDATGAMYAEFELAEQIQSQPGTDWKARLKPVTKSPYLEVRGVNMFLTVQDVDNPDGAFWSDDYWDKYLGIMARSRYNFLDIHGLCDPVTLTFPNGFSFFLSLPDFTEVGVGPERAAKNLARFRQVIAMAADRGIKMGYMNYEAPPPIGPWKTRRVGVDERWKDVPQDFLEGPRLVQYTREAVLSFLKQLPGLWMFGFRVGESGQPEDFYQKTYLAALAELPPTQKVYLRTWIADPQRVRELAASTKNHIYIEPKYNGEQLGLPYQASLGGREYPPSGSYENYTDKPQNYSIIWQIRAHGTHRVFYWGSPEFARRTVRSCKFGDGVGFSMEPMEAYMTAADYLHNNPKTDHGFYKWMVERQWIWHLIWGRTAYDPDVPDHVFIDEFSRHFGTQVGPLVFHALTESSKIVPFVYSYHNIGMDHQDYAPEFENGDHAPGARSRLWQGNRLVPYGGNNDDFLRVNTLDRTAMASPAVYVDDALNSIATGKMTPFEAATYLDDAASRSSDAIEQAAKVGPESARNFECIRMDIEAVAWLGRYYRDRILSATHLLFYEKTYHHPELTQAYDYMQKAAQDWDRLSDITEEHFGFVPEYIRMGVKDFRWRDEGRSLGVDLDQLNNLELAYRRLPHQDGMGVVIGHVPPSRLEPGKPATLQATYATPSETPHVYVFYRNSAESGFSKLDLKQDDTVDRTWSVTIPAEQIKPGFLEYYFGANSGVWSDYDETIAHRPPFRVQVTSQNSKPTFTYSPPDNARGKFVNFNLKVTAASPLHSVSVYYKLMPASYEWLRIEMHPSADGSFSATVPLTPEGILYYFEALDETGNAAHYPNFLDQTPYFSIDSWAPESASR